MIQKMRHYHECTICHCFGKVFHIVAMAEIDAIACEKCLRKIIGRFNEFEFGKE